MTYFIRCPGLVLSYTELVASAIVDVGRTGLQASRSGSPITGEKVAASFFRR